MPRKRKPRKRCRTCRKLLQSVNQTGYCKACLTAADNPDDPTPAEIREQCQLIPAEWSHRERRHERSCYPVTRWTVPTVVDPGIVRPGQGDAAD